jgi:hypothetical protein
MKHVNKTGKLPVLDDYSRECVYHCTVEKKYIMGADGFRSASGKAFIDISGNVFLSKAGMDFCWKPIPWEMNANIALAIITAASIVIAVVKSF